MSLWFRRVGTLDTETMREVAAAADVSWSNKTIVYRGQGIGYADGDPSDATVIQDAAESLLGYRLVEIDEPPEPKPTDE